MDRLRPRDKQPVSGFSKDETEKLERLLKKSVEQLLDPENCRKVTRNLNRSSSRAGKPIIKWIEVQSWFQTRLQECQSKLLPESFSSEKAHTGSQMPKGEKELDPSDLEFEAKSSKDGAWYDVETFLTHRLLDSGEAEVRIRFVGFGADEDEWVNVENAVRLRSVPIEHSECHNVKVGDLLLCLQERRDQAVYYDARVIDIERKMHDVRGCRCIFLVRYEHDEQVEERVRLRRLCYILNT